MATRNAPSRSLPAVIIAALVLSPTFGLTACVSSSYAGIPFAAGAADSDLQQLARRAQAGDKQAQLELGIRYEEGRGVPVNRRRAERLYRSAATASGGMIQVYSPPVGKHGSGRIIPLNTGQRRAGLAEARRRLDALR